MKDMNALRNTEVLNEDNEPMIVAHWTYADSTDQIFTI